MLIETCRCQVFQSLLEKLEFAPASGAWTDAEKAVILKELQAGVLTLDEHVSSKLQVVHTRKA